MLPCTAFGSRIQASMVAPRYLPDFTAGQFPEAPKPHATRSTRRTSGYLDSGRLQSAAPIRLRWARDTCSKLRAHTTGIPSSGDRTTSVDSPRIVRVTGQRRMGLQRQSDPATVQRVDRPDSGQRRRGRNPPRQVVLHDVPALATFERVAPR